MKFSEIELKGAFTINIEPIQDERGFFARNYCKKEFEEHGILFDCVQTNVSFNKKKGTLRGMHFQKAPYEESKIVTCTKGAINDVIIDIRPGSLSFKKWYSIELTARNRVMVFVPKGFAHGFQTLSDDAEIHYMMSEFYHSEYSAGIRWDDPAFKISWPSPVTAISERDRSYPLFEGFV